MNELETSFKRLCADFNLGTYLSYEENTEGVLNKNYVIATDIGRYFIKSVREKRRASLPYIAATEAFFYQKGIPAICMLESISGEKVVTYDSETYTVYPFLESTALDPLATEDFHTMGAMLGRIHDAGSRDVPDVLRGKLFDEKEPALVLERLRAYRDSIGDPANETDHLFSRYIELKLHMAESMQAIPSLPMDTLTHGDFHARNILCDKDRTIIGVIDWEQASMNARAYELARSLLYVCFDTYNHDVSLETARRFLNGYIAVVPISYEEFVAGMRLRWKKLVYSFWIEEQYFVRNDSRSNKFIPHEMKLIQDFADDRVLAQLRF